jgi:hypothetical protein
VADQRDGQIHAANTFRVTMHERANLYPPELILRVRSSRWLARALFAPENFRSATACPNHLKELRRVPEISALFLV